LMQEQLLDYAKDAGFNVRSAAVEQRLNA